MKVVSAPASRGGDGKFGPRLAQCPASRVLNHVVSTRLRIFLSSPGDVSAVREIPALTIERLAQDYARFRQCRGTQWLTRGGAARGTDVVAGLRYRSTPGVLRGRVELAQQQPGVDSAIGDGGNGCDEAPFPEPSFEGMTSGRGAASHNVEYLRIRPRAGTSIRVPCGTGAR